MTTCKNIKSKQTSKAVSSALKSILYYLKSCKSVPPNGLVICAGEIDLSDKKLIESKCYI